MNKTAFQAGCVLLACQPYVIRWPGGGGLGGIGLPTTLAIPTPLVIPTLLGIPMCPIRYTYPPREGPGTRDTYPLPQKGPGTIDAYLLHQKGPGTRNTYPSEETWYQRYLPPEQIDKTPVKTLPTRNYCCGR